jgi:hypothetical protein
MPHDGSLYHQVVTQRDQSEYNYQWHLSDINEIWFFWGIFENIEMPNFKKIRPVGAELFHVDGLTGTHDDDNNRFVQFCERT